VGYLVETETEQYIGTINIDRAIGESKKNRTVDGRGHNRQNRKKDKRRRGKIEGDEMRRVQEELRWSRRRVRRALKSSRKVMR
jgi:hypothetical protein